MKLLTFSLTSLLLASACVLAEKPGADPAAQTITVPAISFTAEGDGNVKKVEPSRTSPQSARRYVHFWYTPGHWLEWTVDAPAAGDYKVSLTYATKYRALRGLKVDGEAAKGLESFVLEPTGRWSDWKEIALPAMVSLKQGKNVLRLTCMDDSSVRLSQISLSAVGKEPIVLDAPRLSGQGGGEVQIITPPTLGYLRDWAGKGHWLEWNVEAPTAGEYSIRLHYATDDWCLRELKVNGQTVKGLESFALGSTGDDVNWREAKLPATVTLKRGRNILRMTSLTSAELGLSAIRLTSPPDGEKAAELFPAGSPATQPAARPDFKPAPFQADSLGPALPAVTGAVDLKPGAELRLGGMKATVKKMDALPYVSNTFSSRYVYERFENPLLGQFRRTYKLDEVIAAGKDELEKQLLLMEWVFDQWDFGHGRERYDLRDPFEILQYARREHKFQCMHSAAVLQTAANCLGWVCRTVIVPNHTFNEVWSNQYRRWVMFDATSNYAPQRAGAPLDAFELRQALLYEDGNGVVSLRHADGRFTRTPKDPRDGQGLLFIGYIPNTDNLLSGPDYAQMFITKDKLCEGHQWHTRECPTDPAVDPYFPINQAALAFVPDGAGFKVTLGTMTPNFKEFQVRQGGGEWKASASTFTWTPHKSDNTLEARSVNKFGVAGPISIIELEAGR